ncbi:MAG: pilin, partial [Patescibacteria group bacterium]
MSFVRIIKKNLTKILIASILTLFLGTFFVSTTQADFGEFVGDLFKTGEQGLSFTEYTGQLAQLSPEGFDTAIVASTDLKQFIIKVVNFALGFLGLIAVVMMIYGGVLYVTSQGEDEATGKGKKIIGYTAVGLLIVLGSFAFVNTVIKGATGGVDEGSGSTAITSTQGFNAAAEQVRSLAIQIYSGFSFLAESTEELKNIKNDIDKGSLMPTALPTRNDILTFLGSLGNKLNTMKSKLQPFTVAEAKINELLRGLDTEIDIINNASGEKKYIKIDGNTYKICDPDKEKELDDKLLGDSDESVCGDSDYDYYYSTDLFDKWTKIYNKYAANNSALDVLIDPIAADYYTDLQKRIFPELSEIYLYYSNIEAIGQGKAQAAYNQMIGMSGYGYKYASGAVTQETSGLLKSVDQWDIVTTKIEDAGQLLIYGLKQHSIIYEELLKLKFVQARLTADTIEGSAPLVVNFNALTTVDPAGGSVQGDNITWDLAGTQTVESLTRGDSNDFDGKKKSTVSFGGGMFMPKDGSVNCTFQPPKGTAEDFIGKTAKRCIYNKPGTYTAAVKINSNNPTKYAPGLSVLTIKVRPPTTKIELTVQGSGDQEPVTVMHYEDDVLLTDKNVVSVTHNDAKSGIVFDAGATKDVKQFKWDFGDGETTKFSTSGKATHKYDEP